MNNAAAISEVRVGDVVRFAKVMDPGDETARMTVLEVEADRNWALVEDICDLPLKPTRTVRLSEIVKA